MNNYIIGAFCLFVLFLGITIWAATGFALPQFNFTFAGVDYNGNNDPFAGHGSITMKGGNQ